MSRTPSVPRTAFVLAVAFLAPLDAFAQPSAAVGIHAGAVLQPEPNPLAQPVWMPSLEVPLGSRFSFQWGGSRWTDGTTIPAKRAHPAAGFWTSAPDDRPIPSTRTVTTIDVNLLFRGGTSRWSAFAGGGVNAQETADDLGGHASTCRATTFSRPELCILPTGSQQPLTVIRSRRFGPQLTAGTEFTLAGPLAAVGTIRVAKGDRNVAATVTGGLRVAFGPRRATQASGQRETHSVRNGALIGLATGVALSLVETCNTWGDDCSNPRAWLPFFMLIEGGIGAAAGAGIGALTNLAR